MKQAVILALSAKAAAANERSSLKLRGAKTSQSEAERELTNCNNKWHPEHVNGDGCSNSLFYPLEWEGVDSLFFDDIQSCCDFFRTGQDCKVYDICGDGNASVLKKPKCTSNKYHPEIKTQDGCSNSIDGYPPEWDEKPELYFFDSSESCCSFFFPGNASGCKVYKVCEEGDLPSITPAPTSLSPINKPTTTPTNIPTNPPSTSAPSQSPTVTPIKYYIVFSTGICTPLDAFTPYWLKEEDFFLDYNACCEKSWNTDACLAVSPTQAPTTMKPSESPSNSPSFKPILNLANELSSSSPSKPSITVSPTPSPSQNPSTSPSIIPIKYYQVFSTGICTPLDAFTPYWLKEEDFFLDYQACCTKSWNTDACLAASPTQAPTTMKPSEPPSKSPSSKPTLHPSSSPSLPPTSLNPTSAPSSSPSTSPSAKPSYQPTSLSPTTLQPVTNKPTNSPTRECASGLWHPSDDYSKCTNSFWYDKRWRDDPTLKAAYMHETARSCCDFWFEFFGQDCFIEDICDFVSPAPVTSLPVPVQVTTSTTTTTTTTTTSSKTQCNASPYWHPTEDYSACTNNFEYKNDWNYPPMKETYLEESLADCCRDFFETWSKECVVDDVCATSISTEPPTNKPTNSVCTNPWHIDTSFKSCSNDLNFPSQWSLPEMAGKFVFDDEEGRDTCCHKFFWIEGKSCTVSDNCVGTFSILEPPTNAPTSKPSRAIVSPSKVPTRVPTRNTDAPSQSLLSESAAPTRPQIDEKQTQLVVSISDCGRPYHPTTSFNGCSNSLDHPKSWSLPHLVSSYMFDTSELCCEKFFYVRDKECIVEDTCPGVPSNKPTSQSTTKSTSHSPAQSSTQIPTISAPSSQAPSKSSVTLSPTNQPTSRFPTYTPSARPTKEKWYPDRNINYSEGRCITAQPIPQFRDTYDTLHECCEKAYPGQSSGACMSEEETKTSSTTTILQFYSQPSNGMCAIVDESTPSWIPDSDYFTNWSECCKAGWKYDDCMAENPFQVDEEGTSDDEETSTTSSTTTVLQIYSNPSNGMCAVVDESTPSWITTFYTDWSECCKAGWKYDECMAENPFQVDKAYTLDDEVTSTTSSTTTVLQFYSNPSNGMCAVVDESTPSWITTFYTDWSECCKAGWKYDECMAKIPSK